MVKSKRLAPIKKLAHNREQQAARELGAAIERQKAEQLRLNQLLQFQREYLASMDDKVRQGISGASLQHYHQFLHKIDIAIEQQKQVLSQCQARIVADQKRWQSDHGRHKAIDQVIDRFKEHEQKAIQKRDSLSSDEMSTQAFIRRQKLNVSIE